MGLYLIQNNHVFNNYNDIKISQCLISYLFRLLTAILRQNNYHTVNNIVSIQHRSYWYLMISTSINFQMVSLEFFIDIILPTAIWSWGRLNL